MLKHITTWVALLTITVSTTGFNYIDARNDAMQLLDKQQYEKAMAKDTPYRGSRATVYKVSILVDQGRTAEALQEMQRWLGIIDIDELQGGWYPALLREAHARTLASAGRKKEAVAKYREALAVEDIHQRLEKRIKKALAKLQESQMNPE